MAASKLSFEAVKTGRTRGSGDLVHGLNGEPEVEYTLFADVDGVKVPVVTKPGNYIQALVAKGKEQQKDETKDETNEPTDDVEQQ